MSASRPPHAAADRSSRRRRWRGPLVAGAPATSRTTSTPRTQQATQRRERQRRPRARRSSSASPARRPTTAGSRPSTSRPRQRPRVRRHRARAAEGTNDANLQISQIETFINDEVDAIVLLPTDGAALTEVATKAMEAGIPVVNVDREFSSPFAARTTILGDNYGMGVSAGTYACELIEDKNITDPVIAEIAGIDSLPLTQDRSQGFADALEACGQKVDNQVAAEFTVESGEEQASNLLQAAPKIDVIWNHDDDQGVGVKAALDNAGRDEFFFIGGAGSCNAMDWIEDGEMEATVLYPPTQAADGIKLARLIAQNKGMSDLVQVEVPKRIVLNAPVVTEDNVEEYLPLCFES